jgi:DHA1 family inner membrane transport protein
MKLPVETHPHRQAPHWPMVLLIVGSGVVSAFQVGKATVALAAIESDLGVAAVVAFLRSAFAIVGAVAGVAIGLAVDHIGARRMAVGALVLQGVCSASGALSDSAAMLLTTRVLEGFGFLAATVAAPPLIVQVARQRVRDRAFALWATFMPVGITGVLLAAPLLSAIGWRASGGVLPACSDGSCRSSARSAVSGEASRPGAGIVKANHPIRVFPGCAAIRT